MKPVIFQFYRPIKNEIYKLNINHKIEIDKLKKDLMSVSNIRNELNATKKDITELETISIGLIYMRLMDESIKVKRNPNNKNQIVVSYLKTPDEIKERLKGFKTTLLKHTNKEIVDTIFKKQSKTFELRHL